MQILLLQDSKLGSPGPRFRILSALEQRELSEPPTRCRWHGCAGASGMVLELLLLTSATRSTTSMMSTPTRDLQVCRHRVLHALTRMLTRTCCALLGRVSFHFNDYGTQLLHPRACLAVQVW